MKSCGRAREATDDNIWLMRFACWIVQSTDTQGEYVILFTFPRQHWLGERALTVRLYVHCLSSSPSILSNYFCYIRILLIVCHYQNFSFPPLCSLGGAVLAIVTSKPAIRTLVC
jgi:hypothetical protein